MVLKIKQSTKGQIFGIQKKKIHFFFKLFVMINF